MGGDAAEEVGFLPQADISTHARECLQGAFGVPLVQQHTGGLGVEVSAVARQFLVAVQNGHHCQQQRIAGQQGDGLGLADGLLQAVVLRRCLCWVVEGHLVPALHEVVDLCGVQVMQHEVPKLDIAQPLRLIAHYTRCDEDGQVRELAGEPLDVIHDVCAELHVKDFIQPIQ